MELVVYINEVSLKDKDITKEYIEILEYLLSYGVKIYRNTKFKNIYNLISDSQLKKRLIDIFTNKRGQTYKWDDENCLNCGLTEVYFFDEEGRSQIEKDSSIGEFISKKFIDNQNYCFLLNFDNSHIRSNRELNVYEYTYTPKFTDIILFDNLEDIKVFCKEYIYTDLDFEHPPQDKQTILRNKSLFDRTGKPKQDGRTIYRNKDNGYFYYVDNLHTGNQGGAELEVFNRSNHIGVADINLGKIDKSKKEDGRRID